MDTQSVAVRVLRVTPLTGERVFALASVELEWSGLAIRIHGIRISSVAIAGGQSATKVELPTYRDASGAWRTAIDLPDELREPIADAVLAQLIDEGIARRLVAPLPPVITRFDG